jgi:hypothetical protein
LLTGSFPSTKIQILTGEAATRQSWCPGAMSSSLAASFAAFPSKALGNKGVLSSGIEEGDEAAEDEVLPCNTLYSCKTYFLTGKK